MQRSQVESATGNLQLASACLSCLAACRICLSCLCLVLPTAKQAQLAAILPAAPPQVKTLTLALTRMHSRIHSAYSHVIEVVYGSKQEGGEGAGRQAVRGENLAMGTTEPQTTAGERSRCRGWHRRGRGQGQPVVGARCSR